MGRYKDLAKCVDCGVRRLVKHNEWLRASRPRCMACGGIIEPSHKAYKEHVSHHDAERDDKVKRDKKTNKYKI